MSQSRTRKAPGVGAAPRSRPPAKASDVSVKPQQQPQTNPPRSKSKIPKSVRYDLENALVGLCDVWFEEIKPHLLRNNIKVHVHGAGAGEGGAGGGDQRTRLPPGAPGCSHLDPALSAPRCELCRLLFNAANSIESAVSQAATAVIQAPVAGAFSTDTPITREPAS
ncbi:uncharacterized protein LOC126376349 [Pectinophora gossypiella]|uniref:uncharacterized protein LOC126376349 n=1 Tax=Pectinophora gossypiella TaxID=13191 RepID=UPI00214F1C90|nr:uncharacterized protein LOC126376349 [Pectinophora gossypiella]